MKSTVIVNVGEIFWYRVDFLMDESQQLKQLVSTDIPSLGKYYREMAQEQGAGVLVVNYYPIGEVAQMEARFLKSSQIPRLSRQMGLPSLQTVFEQHDREKEMTLAIVTAETKGAIAVELQLPAQVSESQTPAKGDRTLASKAKSKSSDTTTKKRASSAKTTTQRQAKNKPNATATSATSKPKAAPKQTSQPSPQPSTQPEAAPQPIAEPDTTAKSTSKAKTTAKTSKPATRGKTATRGKIKQKPQPEVSSQTAFAPIAEPEATPQPTVEPQTTPKSTSAKSTSKTSTSANQHKTSPKSTAKQKSQPKASPQTPSPIPEDRSDEPEPETTAQPPAKRKSSTTASARRKSSSGAATKRRTTTPRARGKKQS